MLGLSVYTARELGRRGQLPVTTIGRRVAVRESSLRRFLEQREPRMSGTPLGGAVS